MPKTIESPAARRDRLAGSPPLSWPYSQRHLLPAGHNRADRLYDSSRSLPCYRNGGGYPGNQSAAPAAPFSPAPNRRSRRLSGQRGDGYGEHYEPRTSPRTAPYANAAAPRASVEARRKRRASLPHLIRGLRQWPERHNAPGWVRIVVGGES